MKYILLILFALLTVNAIAQREHKCKTGYQCIPTMATSGYKMVGGCFPDSVARKKLNAFYKAMCEETQTGEFSDNLSYENRHVWYDSTGCVECKIWKVLRNGKWIEITKKEYDSLSALK